MIRLPDAQLDVRMPFPEEVKYVILGISLLLLLIALAILIWQLQKCCCESYDSKGSVSQLMTDDAYYQSENSYQDLQRPRFQGEYAHQQTHRLDHYLSQSQASLPSSALHSDGGSLESLEEQEGSEGEHLRGSLHFSLYYDQLQALLVVTVLEARALPPRPFSGSVDPFVHVRLLWVRGPGREGEVEQSDLENEEGEEGKEEEEKERRRWKEKGVDGVQQLQWVLHEWQTHLVRSSSNPAFGDQFSCSLPEQDLHHLTVKLEVRDFDKYSRHGTLGEVRAPLRDLNISYPLDMWQDLQRPRKDLVGEMLLSLRYMPTSQRLEVGILKMRMSSKPSKTDPATLSIRASVQCNQCKLRHQKTSSKVQNSITVFNEVLIFVLPDPPLQECTIAINVYVVHPKKKPSKHLIGQLTVGKGKRSEDEHWRLMMRALRQPIAQWHLLYI